MTTPRGPTGPTGPSGPSGPTTPTGHTGPPETTTHRETTEHHPSERREYRPTEGHEPPDLGRVRSTSRVSWGGIFVGLFVTIAVGLTLLSLGAGLGLSTVDPAAMEAAEIGWGTGFWSILTVILATFIGAFVGVKASNLRTNRDAGIQGGVIWAFSFPAMTLFIGMMAAMGALVAVEPGVAVAEIGEAATWGYFVAAILGAVSGVLGGLAGFPVEKPAREERRERERAPERRRELRPGEA